jgi:hypothetical protein
MVVSICGCFNDLAMQVLGTSKWTGYVVRELLLGPKRFGDPGGCRRRQSQAPDGHAAAAGEHRDHQPDRVRRDAAALRL